MLLRFRSAFLAALLGLLSSSAARAVSVDDPHIYLFCNATSYNQNSASELTPKPGDADTLQLTITITQDWMTTIGDRCYLLGTETPGNWEYITHFGIEGAAIAVAKAVRSLRQTADLRTFLMKYPQLGRYRFVLGRKAGTFTFDLD